LNWLADALAGSATRHTPAAANAISRRFIADQSKRARFRLRRYRRKSLKALPTRAEKRP
jgi:hypothetical protein